MAYEKIRIYAEPSTNMINIDDEGGNPLYSEPKGSLCVNCINNKLSFYSSNRQQYLFENIAPINVFNNFGTSYGATVELVRTAINPFLNFFFDNGSITSDDVINASNVPGTNVSDALDYLQTNKLQWATATAISTTPAQVTLLNLPSGAYPPNTIVNIWGKIFAKQIAPSSSFFTGTFTACGFVNASGIFIISTGTIQQTIYENFVTNPIFIQDVIGAGFPNGYRLRVSSGAVATINWVLKYLIDVQTLPA